MKPKDVRVLKVYCDHSDFGKWSIHLLEEEWKALSESYDRIFQDRYDLLTVHTKEGMLASEWLMRTATAERERDEARAERAFIETEYAAANESDLTRDALCLQVASLRALIREAHRELSTIEAITVSTSDTDGLVQLCKRLAAAGKLGAKTESTT